MAAIWLCAACDGGQPSATTPIDPSAPFSSGAVVQPSDGVGTGTLDAGSAHGQGAARSASIATIWIHAADVHGAARFVAHVYRLNVGIAADSFRELHLALHEENGGAALAKVARAADLSTNIVQGMTWIAPNVLLQRVPVGGRVVATNGADIRDIDLDRARVRNVTTILAAFGGAHLTGERLAGAVSLHIEAQPWRFVLEDLLAMSGASHAWGANEIFIQTPGDLPASVRPSEEDCATVDAVVVHDCIAPRRLCVGATSNVGGRWLALIMDDRGEGVVAEVASLIGKQADHNSPVRAVAIESVRVELSDGSVLEPCKLK
jgi:hypothetical protein